MSYEKELEYEGLDGELYIVHYEYSFAHDRLELDSFWLYHSETNEELELKDNEIRAKIIKLIEDELEEELYLNYLNYESDYNDAEGDRMYDSWKEA